LIAGFLAVLAAWLTIRQMQLTDDRQQRRHEELVKLTLRADRLRVRRAAYRRTDDMRQLADEFEGLRQKLQAGLSDQAEEPLIQEAWRARQNSMRKCSDAIDLIRDDLVSAATDLFDAHLATGLKELFQVVETCSIRLTFSQDCFDEKRRSNNPIEVRGQIENLLALMERVSTKMRVVAELLDGLVEEYR
jgi:hypothetical protein